MNTKSFKKKFTLVLFLYTCAILCVWLAYNGIIYFYNQNSVHENMERESKRILEAIESDLSDIKASATLIGGSAYVKDFLTEKNVALYYEKSARVHEIIAKVMGIEYTFDHVITVNESGEFYRFVGSLSNESIGEIFNDYKDDDATFQSVIIDDVGYFCHISPVFYTSYENPRRIGSIIIVNSLLRTRRMIDRDIPSGMDTSVVSDEKVLISTNKALEGGARSSLYDTYDFFAEKQINGIDLTIVVSANNNVYSTINTAFVAISSLIVGLFLILIYTLHCYLSKTMINPLLTTKEQMQMGLLGRQMDAHFLVNTLNTIEILIGKEESDTAKNIMGDLCEILKHQQRGLCNVFMEIDVLERYIEIMNTRHNIKYCVIMDIDEELVDFAMPAFILQPILENALVHGFSKENEDFKVTLIARRYEYNITFTITDNGIGIRKGKLEELQEALKNAYTNEYPKEGLNGVALINIQKRILSQCGAKYGITINSDEGVYTTVTVTLPLLADTAIC